MNYRQHSLLGLFLFVIVYKLLSRTTYFIIDIYDFIICVIISLLASLLPDLDHPRSMTTKIFVALSVLLSVGLIVFNFLSSGHFVASDIKLIILPMFFISVPWLIYSVYGHRNITHSLFTWVVLSMLFFFGSIYFDKTYYVFFFSISFLSHILTDCLTSYGVSIYYPISKRRYHSIIPTNKKIIYIPFIVLNFVGFILFLIWFVFSL